MKKKEVKKCRHFIIDANCVCKRCGHKVRLLSLKEEMAHIKKIHANLGKYL